MAARRKRHERLPGAQAEPREGGRLAALADEPVGDGHRRADLHASDGECPPSAEEEPHLPRRLHERQAHHAAREHHAGERHDGAGAVAVHRSADDGSEDGAGEAADGERRGYLPRLPARLLAYRLEPDAEHRPVEDRRCEGDDERRPRDSPSVVGVERPEDTSAPASGGGADHQST